MNKDIVSAEWLHSQLENKDLVILDGTLPNQLAKMSIEVQNIKIKNTRFFDLKGKFSDTQNEYPTAYPSFKQFQNEAQELGINKESIIVVYDANGIYSSPRVWWLFKSMGHENVFVLDGGLPEWLNHKYPTENKKKTMFSKGNFEVKTTKNIVRFFDDVQQNVTSEKELIVDVRSDKRFKGIVAEPREGLRSGQIPNSINIPYTDVLKDGKFQNKEELLKTFEILKNEKRNIVFSCGSGITACVVYLASNEIIKNARAVYDGSWTEWGDKYKD